VAPVTPRSANRNRSGSNPTKPRHRNEGRASVGGRVASARLLLSLAFFATAVAAAAAAEGDAIERGRYLALAASCVTCHTAEGGQPFAGGRALETPFGTFYTPNITPDRETGIGGWSEAQFLRALHEGVRPDGADYYPAFPYTSFTKLADTDAQAIWAYLSSIPAVLQANRPHALSFPYSWRFLLNGWKWLFFEPGRFQPAPERSAEQNRGAYLVTAVVHCGECHTPRNAFGAMEDDRFLAGNPIGPDGKSVPNITPDPKAGIGNWSEDDIVQVLTDGRTPAFDEVGGAMAEVVRNTAKLNEDDRRAIAAYLQTVPPVSGPQKK
jgi:mono/diheme cytochrome c family protein